MNYEPDCSDCPTPETCRAKNDCQVMRQLRHGHEGIPGASGWDNVTRLLVANEVDRAVVKFPTWPTDPLHAVAILGEEFGELTKAVLQLTYEPHKSTLDDVRSEAIQTAAMALRFLHSLDQYKFERALQHAQIP